MAGTDVEPEPFGRRRLAAWLVDFGVVVVAAIMVISVTHARLAELLTTWPEYAQLGVTGLFSWRGDALDTGTAVGLQAWTDARQLAFEGLAALVAIVLIYQFGSLTLRRRTLGQLVLDLRVSSSGSTGLGTGSAAVRAVVRTVLDIGIYACACGALLAGAPIVAFVLWLVAVFALILDLVVLTRPGRRSLADRLSGTVVHRAGLYRQTWEVARAPVEQGRQAAQTGITAVHTAVDATRLGAARFAESESVRQAREAARGSVNRAWRAARDRRR